MTEDEYSRIENGQVVGEAILYMKSRKPNPDGSIGFIIKPKTPEWAAWELYFGLNNMVRQAHFMRARGDNGYMVPCANPSAFDPTYAAYRARYDRSAAE